MSVLLAHPPSYNSNGDLDPGYPLNGEGVSLSSAELPSYSTFEAPEPSETRQQTEHIISLTVSEKNTYEWLKLKVKSWVPTPKHIPSFVEGAPITGTVELDLPKYEGIKAIVISARGAVVSSAFDERQFLELSETLWDSSMGDPRLPGQTDVQFTDKLVGQYTFPYSITLPKTINFGNKQQLKQLRLSGDENLPPSFSGRGYGASINYELIVDVKRRGILSVGSRCKTLFGYTPVSLPDPPSSLRQEVFRDGIPLLGPEIDIHGWEVVPNVEVGGVVFDTRKVSFNFELALAKPLEYTRGSFIPCYLRMSCDDDQALDLVSQPEAPVVQMRRKVKTRVGVDDVGGTVALLGNQEDNYFNKAVWMSFEDNVPGRRTLYGELSLPSNLTPSFKFGDFDVKYVIDMIPPKVAGFVPDKQDRLCRSEVTITSAYGFGVIPRAILPPSYDPPPPPRVRAAMRDSFL